MKPAGEPDRARPAKLDVEVIEFEYCVAD